MNTRIINLIFLSIVAVFASIWLGIGVASNQSQTLLIVGGTIAFLICILLRQRIWLLYIFLASINIPIIRGFGSEEFGQFALIGFSTLIFTVRKLKLNPQNTELDFWRLAVALVILQVYLRNPVGLNMFGASSVGARPYFIASMALMSGFILSKYQVHYKELKWMMPLTIIGSLLTFPANRLRGGGVGPGGQAGSVSSVGSGVGGAQVAGRIGGYSLLGELFTRVMISRISPLKACVHPLWAMVLIFVLAAAAASGYRNAVASVGMLLLVGIAYRGGFVSVILSILMALMALAVLAIVNVTAPLPPNVQRALSPFPGTWEERYVDDASNSSEWRYEMWREALFTDKWIENKIIGDGLGFSRLQLEQMQSMEGIGAHKAVSGLNQQQESMMIQGSYHSGPVQTIRTVGYLGLLVMLMAMTRIAIHAHQQIMRCRNTEWFPMMLFFGVPMITYPIFFTFVFGTFDEGVAHIFIQSGLLDLIRKNLPIPGYIKKNPEPYIFKNHLNNRSQRASA
jgi:hypothetical protein